MRPAANQWALPSELPPKSQHVRVDEVRSAPNEPISTLSTNTLWFSSLNTIS